MHFWKPSKTYSKILLRRSLGPRANLGCEAERFTAISPAETFCRRTSTSRPQGPEEWKFLVASPVKGKVLLQWTVVSMIVFLFFASAMNEHLASCETFSIFFSVWSVILEVLKPFGKGLYINLIRHISQEQNSCGFHVSLHRRRPLKTSKLRSISHVCEL